MDEVHQPEAAEGRQQAHRHDQDDRQRQRPALVQAGEHQEHQQYAQRKDQYRGVALGGLLVGQVGPLEVEAARQHLRGQLAHAFKRLGRRQGRRVDARGDVRRGIGVVADHRVGAVAGLEVDDAAHRHHLPALVADLEA